MNDVLSVIIDSLIVIGFGIAIAVASYVFINIMLDFIDDDDIWPGGGVA